MSVLSDLRPGLAADARWTTRTRQTPWWAAGVSLALHLAVLAAILVALSRETPPEPVETSVALVWSDAAPDEAAPGADTQGAPTQAAPPAPPPEIAAPSLPDPAPPPPAAPAALPPPVPSPASRAALPEPAAQTERPLPPPLPGDLPAPASVPPPPPPVAEAAPAAAEPPPHPPAPATPPPRRAAARAPAPPAPPPSPTRAETPSRQPGREAPGAPEGAGQSPLRGTASATGALTPPQLDRSAIVQPTYPESSRRNNEEGTVTLMLRVAEDGHVAGAELDRSSGYAALDQQAQRTVLRWHFRPATRDGLAVPSTVRTSVTFRLQGAR